jgi:hypothetical protein
MQAGRFLIAPFFSFLCSPGPKLVLPGRFRQGFH